MDSKILMDSKISIKKVSHTNADLAELFFELDTGLEKLYPGEDIGALGKTVYNIENYYFLVAYLDGRAVGCGCIKPLSKYACELKRMFVKEGFRKKGIAIKVIEKLLAEAKKRGFRKILLETGPMQPEAINLYKKLGFEETGPFARYEAVASSVFFVKEI